MQFKIGTVYRNKSTLVDFIAVQSSYDDATNIMTFHLVNVVNWIVLSTHEGKLLTDGRISCASLDAATYDHVAASAAEYYSGKATMTILPAQG